ncbi:unnamed protein product [Bemisia tabaci]|uniref:Uncharacterized protein n=1 Tax=Bemisia tabaci TaxID=7038 RepID=A0A9P0ANW0_BEMTA|nr:unnamed protein product [Bemisia tabaci]
MEQRVTGNSTQYIWGRSYFSPNYDFRKIFYDKLLSAKTFYQRDLIAHFGCVNAIEFSKDGSQLVSGGDDRRVLLWDVQSALRGENSPVAMKTSHVSNIFCLAIDSRKETIFSGGNDDQVIVHNIKTGEPVQYFLHHQSIYGISMDPFNDNLIAIACDDGKVVLHDIRESSSTEHFVLASSSSAFHSVYFNPSESRLLATANATEGAALWDIRKPKQMLLRFGKQTGVQSCMSVRWDQMGSRLLALRRRLPPVLYSVASTKPIAQFDHAGYYNSCTMKSCSFGGDRDQFVLSGSDDFNLYIWKTPKTCAKGNWIKSAHMVLKGHRSIVNQVRYDPNTNIIASSGVEKLIKFWSCSPYPPRDDDDDEELALRHSPRKVFTHEEYLRYVLMNGEFIISHDYTNKSTNEDPRMMAFFDSLVQREIEGWSSDNSNSSFVDDDSSDESSSSESELDENSGSSPSRTSILESIRTVKPPIGMVTPERKTQSNVSECSDDESDKDHNPIVELIAKKRSQLVKMAKNGQNEFHSVRKRLKLNKNDSIYSEDDSCRFNIKIRYGESSNASTSESDRCPVSSNSNSYYATGTKRRKNRVGCYKTKNFRKYVLRSRCETESDSEGCVN